jgi:RimJ/RimL family protein N-acetyltransferase
MENNTIQQIEEAGLNAWPAHQQLLYDGWLLRFADGYTKRANSVNPLYPSSLEVESKIERCEAFYQRTGLPPVFRLTPLAPRELDAALDERSYQVLHPTRVLTMNLEGWGAPELAAVSVRELPLEQWMGVFSEISGSVITKQPAHAQILRNILNPYFCAAIEIDGKWVACGLGVQEGEWFGLFDIVTRPEHRRQGLSTRLIAAMLDWALSQGARRSYLQVMESNQPALGLYAKLGYADRYGYWYRVPEGS